MENIQKKNSLWKTQDKYVKLNNGRAIADNGDIVRVDLFKKEKKYHAVNIYAWQVAKGILPQETTTGLFIDESYIFQFSLFKNDLVKIPNPNNKSEYLFAYFIRPDDELRWILKLQDNATIPDGFSKKENNSFRLSFQNQLFIEKYHIDELGKNIRLCKPSKRQAVR